MALKGDKVPFYEIKDSGNRRLFDSGAQRDRQRGKGRPVLMSPFALMRLAAIYEKGGEKYSERNYEKGMPLSEYMDSAFRHLIKLMLGWKDEDHAAMLAWNMFSFMHTQDCINNGLLPKELNDTMDYTSKEAFIKALAEFEKIHPPRNK